ncbi:MAG: hypothetical protein IKJ19_00480 [Clostridia bacterium]|nr:hypothetical protein [Clostridia bacterium]
MKKIFIVLLAVCSMVCTTIGLTACSDTSQQPVKEKIETIVSFDDYNDVLLTLRKLGNSFGRTEINKDMTYITQGTGSLKVQPEGDYSHPDKIPYLLFGFVGTNAKTCDFSNFSTVKFDIYNAEDKELTITTSWKFPSNSGEEVFIEETTTKLAPKKWTTISLDMEKVVYEYNASMALELKIDFHEFKKNKEDTINTFYIDNLRGENLDSERKVIQVVDYLKYNALHLEGESYDFDVSSLNAYIGKAGDGKGDSSSISYSVRKGYGKDGEFLAPKTTNVYTLTEGKYTVIIRDLNELAKDKEVYFDVYNPNTRKVFDFEYLSDFNRFSPDGAQNESYINIVELDGLNTPSPALGASNNHAMKIIMPSPRIYPAFYFELGREYPVNTEISFKVFIDLPQEESVINRMEIYPRKTSAASARSTFGLTPEDYGIWKEIRVVLAENTDTVWAFFHFAGLNNTGVVAYLDDFAVSSVPVEFSIKDGGLTFENDDIHISHLISDGTLNANNNPSDKERIAYADEGIAAPSPNNNYGVKITGAAGHIYPAFRIEFGEVIKKGQFITFKLFVNDDPNKDYHVNRIACKPELSGIRGGELSRAFIKSEYNKWIDCSFKLNSDSDCIWVFYAYNTTNPDLVQGASIYVDDCKIVQSSADITSGYSFESEEPFVFDAIPSGVLNANTQSGAISRVAYEDENIPTVGENNAYGVKIEADSNKAALVFRINFGKQLSAGDEISFNIYVKQPTSVTDASKLMRLNAKPEYTTTTATRGSSNMVKAFSGASTSFKYETWLTVTFTLTKVNANDPNGIWVGMEYPSGITNYSGVIAYIDNVVYTKAEQFDKTPAIEEGYNFEDNAKLDDMVSSGVLNATAQSGAISKVKYADEGITTDDANKYGVKIVADANMSALVFRINFGKQLSAGDKISFNIYVKQPTSVTDASQLMRLNAKPEYTTTTATRGSNMVKTFSGASTSFEYETWLTVTFTLTQVNPNDPNGIWVGMEYPSGITNYSGVIAYIDNVTYEEKVELSKIEGVTFEGASYYHDGKEKQILVSGTLPEGVTVAYTNNKATEVGVYSAKAVLSGEGYETLTLTATLEIKALREITGVTFENASCYYDSKEKQILVKGELPEGVTVAYTNNKATEVGVYSAKAVLSGEGYETLTLTATLEIKALREITGVTFENASYYYDSKEKQILVNGELPEGVTVAYTNNKGTEVGVYNAIATLSGEGYETLELKATLEVMALRKITGVTFENASCYYDGKEKQILVNGELPEGVTVTYKDNKATGIGVYNAVATLSGEGYETLVLNAVLEIKTLSGITGISFKDASFYYDGSEKEIVIEGELPEGVAVSYTNNKATEVGVYSAVATLSGEGYETLELKATLEIMALREITGVTFESASYYYDGAEKQILLNGELPEGVTVVYNNNKGTEVGVYNAIATLSGEGYESLELNATLEIKALKVISGITFEGASYYYDGAEKQILVNGELPEGVTVAYTNNKGTEVGVYNAIAILSGEGYETLELKATLEVIALREITGVTFENALYYYDGVEKQILVNGELPEGVTVEYENNVVKEVGLYEARAILSGVGYETLILEAIIEIVEQPDIEKGYSFETNAVLSDMVKNGVINTSTQSGEISRVKYADEGISAPTSGNEYAVKVVSVEGKQYLSFRIDLGKQLNAGDKVTFKMYVVTATSPAVKVYAKSEYVNGSSATRHDDWMNREYSGASTSFKYATWLTCTLTLTAAVTDNPNSIWFSIDYSDASTAELVMYIDDITVEKAPAKTPTIEEGYNFETDAVLSDMVKNGITNASTQSGEISRVKYADEGISAPTSGNEYAVKVVSVEGKQYLSFRIDLGEQLNAGDEVTFKIYVVTATSPAVKVNAKSEYVNGSSATLAGAFMSRTYSGASTSFKYATWLTCTFTLTAVGTDNPNSIWFSIEYSDASTAELVMYIDDITVIKAS